MKSKENRPDRHKTYFPTSPLTKHNQPQVKKKYKKKRSHWGK
jgi:hypothetical protein